MPEAPVYAPEGMATPEPIAREHSQPPSLLADQIAVPELPDDGDLEGPEAPLEEASLDVRSPEPATMTRSAATPVSGDRQIKVPRVREPESASQTLVRRLEPRSRSEGPLASRGTRGRSRSPAPRVARDDVPDDPYGTSSSSRAGGAAIHTVWPDQAQHELSADFVDTWTAVIGQCDHSEQVHAASGHTDL